MARTPRDRTAEATAITTAGARLLAGTPLRSTSGKLTTTELIIESGLRRDVIYEHADLVEEFQARVKAQHSTPSAMQALADKHEALLEERDKLRSELAAERNTTGLLRKIVAELSLELNQATDELTASQGVTRLAERDRRPSPPPS